MTPKQKWQDQMSGTIRAHVRLMNAANAGRYGGIVIYIYTNGGIERLSGMWEYGWVGMPTSANPPLLRLERGQLGLMFGGEMEGGKI